MHKKVVEALDEAGIPYNVHFHEHMPVIIRSPKDFARSLGYDVSRISKTLLVRATDRQIFCLVVAPSDKRINLEIVAGALEVKRVQMASRQELSNILDYPPTGVSPLGSVDIPVLMDEGLTSFDTILIGSGQVGVEIEMCPAVLQKITRARLLTLTL